jgi:phosphomannomutase
MHAQLTELMERSGVRFGTSGARGLASELTDQVAYVYTRGFLQYLRANGEFDPARGSVAVAGDLRPSTGRLIAAVCRAITDAGSHPLHAGRVPSPAVALCGFSRGIPSVMVTGSHIPADRNGIKFNRPQGEILKSDEAGIAGQTVEWPEDLFDGKGSFAVETGLPPADPGAARAYVARYFDVFDRSALHGLRLGVYQHSAVGRDLLIEILEGLGATVTPLGRSDQFVPVDTEAIRPEDVNLAARWAAAHQFDAIVSTDGDSDRPLISDAAGRWLRGDIAGILCARFLNADSVSTPISSNSAVELCDWFPAVRRTRIGSPYVIESMTQAAASGARRVVGYEANGGFLIQSDLDIGGRMLRALPTRDSVILMLAILLLARREAKSVADLVRSLPPRYTASDRLQDFPIEKSRAILASFNTGDEARDRRAIEAIWGAQLGRVMTLDRTDGLRIGFANGEIVHLRPSGNAPEFRCYTEASSESRAIDLNRSCLELLSRQSSLPCCG